MGFLKSLVKIGGIAKLGASIGGAFAASGGVGVVGSQALVSDLMAPRLRLGGRYAPPAPPGRSALFVSRRDPTQVDEFASLNLQRDLDVFRVPLIDLFGGPQ